MNICEKDEILKMRGLKIDEALAEMISKRANALKL